MWETSGNVTMIEKMDKHKICSGEGSDEGTLMLMPSQLDWFHSRDLCRKFGGRLHVDKSLSSAKNRTIAMVERGETLRPDRCVRVWLGATDLEEEGIWKDSENNEILDVSEYWTTGQPNGVRVQNCLGVWEFVSAILK